MAWTRQQTLGPIQHCIAKRAHGRRLLDGLVAALQDCRPSGIVGAINDFGVTALVADRLTLLRED
jgi:hypothetical protein